MDIFILSRGDNLILASSVYDIWQFSNTRCNNTVEEYDELETRYSDLHVCKQR